MALGIFLWTHTLLQINNYLPVKEKLVLDKKGYSNYFFSAKEFIRSSKLTNLPKILYTLNKYFTVLKSLGKALS